MHEQRYTRQSQPIFTSIIRPFKILHLNRFKYHTNCGHFENISKPTHIPTTVPSRHSYRYKLHELMSHASMPESTYQKGALREVLVTVLLPSSSLLSNGHICFGSAHNHRRPPSYADKALLCKFNRHSNNNQYFASLIGTCTVYPSQLAHR